MYYNEYLYLLLIALLSYSKSQTELLENAGYYYMETLLSNTKSSPSFVIRKGLYQKANGAYSTEPRKIFGPLYTDLMR